MFIVQCPERLNLHNIMPCFCKRHVKTHVCECVLSRITYNHNKHRFCLLSIRCVNILIIIFVLNSYIHDRIDAYLPNCCNYLLWFLCIDLDWMLEFLLYSLSHVICFDTWYERCSLLLFSYTKHKAASPAMKLFWDCLRSSVPTPISMYSWDV